MSGEWVSMTMMTKSNKNGFYVKKVRKNRRVIFPPVLLQLLVIWIHNNIVTYYSRHYICVLDGTYSSD